MRLVAETQADKEGGMQTKRRALRRGRCARPSCAGMLAQWVGKKEQLGRSKLHVSG
jgi:hypothetical protein